MPTLYEQHGGHETFVALHDHIGEPLPDVVRNAKPPKKVPSHKFGECGAGPSKCKQHRREYQRDLELRKAEQRAVRRERDRILSMHEIHDASRAS